MTLSTLYILCAERVVEIILTTSGPLAARYSQFLKQSFSLPDITINYISSVGEFASVNFKDTLRCTNCWRVQLTRPDAVNYCGLDMTVDDSIYVCSLPNLGRDSMRLDIEAGTYTLSAFHDGYLLRRTTTDTTMHNPSSESSAGNLSMDDLAHVFSAQSHHCGLSCKTVVDVSDIFADDWRARLFDDYFGKSLDNNFFCCSYPIYESMRSFFVLRQSVAILNCIPVLLYLNRVVSVDDLPHISLSCRTPIEDVIGVSVCFYVYHACYGRIGLAVQQQRFCGIIAHVNVLWNQNQTALGNFRVSDFSVYGARVPYVCKFNPCHCYYSKENFVNKIKQ
ncbi:ORF-9 [Agrotis segetum nucleopolyhedrovirus A]|uniref:ORF-9 n=1 Tax=Agrotis segetum nuclear polyhedrosis virus TaxID=1962501 RepID=Q287R3_NPVAS|nr:ORF-9 [Agrotis segetum nucleopolyhedrovirus A]AAZ38175.1 ORF-9 [Agrotis segetum nucleopolyhedrovirus A]